MKQFILMAMVTLMMATTTFANESEFTSNDSASDQEMTVDESDSSFDMNADSFWNPRPYPRCPQGRVVVTCTARDQRGRVYDARGCFHEQVQREAVRECNRFSRSYCEPSGCHVGW